MRKKATLPEKPYCQCCGSEHSEHDSLVVCLKCFRLFERVVRVDLLRKAYANLVVLARKNGVSVEELTAQNSTLDERGRLRIKGFEKLEKDEKVPLVVL